MTLLARNDAAENPAATRHLAPRSILLCNLISSIKSSRVAEETPSSSRRTQIPVPHSGEEFIHGPSKAILLLFVIFALGRTILIHQQRQAACRPSVFVAATSLATGVAASLLLLPAAHCTTLSVARSKFTS